MSLRRSSAPLPRLPPSAASSFCAASSDLVRREIGSFPAPARALAEPDSLPRPPADFLVVGMAAPSSWVGRSLFLLPHNDLADGCELARARRRGRARAVSRRSLPAL